jgi:hypothetical protein
VIDERHLQGTATTSDATPTDLLTLPVFPANGSFTLSGTVIARAPAGDQVTAFFPLNSGNIAASAITQSGGRADAAPCPTAPSDGGVAQGFAPRGCSTTTDGLGLTMPLNLHGQIASLVVVGQAGTVITWSWDLTLVTVTP